MRLRGTMMLTIALVAAVAPATLPRSVVAAVVPGTTCSVFPADNIWNSDVSKLPVHARSAAWLASTNAASTKLHPDFGGPPYGLPYNVVPTSHQTTNFTFQYWDESDPVVSSPQPQGPYPYGSDLVREGPTDSHLLSIDKDTCKLYETGGTDYSGPSTAWSGAIFDLNSNALRPAGWTSADAAGLPIFPGLVRYEEVAAGEKKAALPFTAPPTRQGYILAARHFPSSLTGAKDPALGQRFCPHTVPDI